MGSLPNDSVFIGSRELKGKLAPVNTDENSFSGYLAANSGCRVMGDVEADADTCRILIEEGFYQVAGSLFHEGNQGRCSNCLLYTSPSPRDAHESRMPSSA